MLTSQIQRFQLAALALQCGGHRARTVRSDGHVCARTQFKSLAGCAGKAAQINADRLGLQASECGSQPLQSRHCRGRATPRSMSDVMSSDCSAANAPSQPTQLCSHPGRTDESAHWRCSAPDLESRQTTRGSARRARRQARQTAPRRQPRLRAGEPAQDLSFTLFGIVHAQGGRAAQGEGLTRPPNAR